MHNAANLKIQAGGAQSLAANAGPLGPRTLHTGHYSQEYGAFHAGHYSQEHSASHAGHCSHEYGASHTGHYSHEYSASHTQAITRTSTAPHTQAITHMSTVPHTHRPLLARVRCLTHTQAITRTSTVPCTQAITRTSTAPDTYATRCSVHPRFGRSRSHSTPSAHKSVVSCVVVVNACYQPTQTHNCIVCAL